MPKAKVITSVAGVGFSYSFGEIVDRDEFAEKVGAGFAGLLEAVEEPPAPTPKPKKTKDAE